MSSLRFTKAPSCPLHIDAQLWESEWVGLEVGLASTWPNRIGYLGTGSARMFDDTTHLYRLPTPAEEFDYLAGQLWKDYQWISKGLLIHECTYNPTGGGRPTILKWLAEEPQSWRTVFAVSHDVCEYLL